MQGRQTRGDAADLHSFPPGLAGGCAAPQDDARHQTGLHQGQHHKTPPSSPCPQRTQPCAVGPIPTGCPPCPSQTAPGCSTACPSSCTTPRAASRDKSPSQPQCGSGQNPRCSSVALGSVTGTLGTRQCHHSQPHMGELPGWIKPLIRQPGALQAPSRLEPASPGEGHSEEPGRTQLSRPTGAGQELQNYQ